ncbi:MAG: Stage III sporulation protein AH [Pelotomaculum sp. PtaU1.Bin035]|nr:MAG: Stage III sporulation protein AH [Pelotomaculum sp. PtaU1.Bin035]
MKAVIINKKMLSLISLSVIAIAVLFLCWSGNLGEKTTVPGLQVSRPAAGEVRINGSDAVLPEWGGVSGITGKLNAKESPDFFVEYRLEKERTRGQRVEWLREVINNANSAGETRQKAQENLMSISSSMEKEVEMENLIKAKGFSDAAVLVGDRIVTVIVEAASLATDEAVRLADMVSKGTGVEDNNIVIINKP